jgi:hypothetical protein
VSAVRQLLRLEMLDGCAKWRPLIDLEHATLCKQFGLDPHRVVFDLPSSARAQGSAVAGAGGALRDGRSIDGYVLDRYTRRPIGKLTFAREGERFRELDPGDVEGRLRLGR